MEAVQAELQKLVGEVGRAINRAADAVDVILPLRTLSSILHGSDAQGRNNNGANTASLTSSRAFDEIATVCTQTASQSFPELPSEKVLSSAFYNGPCFATLARLLLHMVSSDWLACFSSVEQRILFDDFFTQAPLSEAIPVLVHGLSTVLVPEDEEEYPAIDRPSAACVQAERLLVLLLITRQGVKKLALSFSSREVGGDGWHGSRGALSTYDQNTSQLANLVSSIPDRTSLEAPSALRLPIYAQSIVSQLLVAAEETWGLASTKSIVSLSLAGDDTFKFFGEIISRLCRRGDAAVIASQIFPRLQQHLTDSPNSGLDHLKNHYSHSALVRVIENLQMSMWPSLAASITDSHALERLSEAFIREMGHKSQFTDWDAYFTLHTFFGKVFKERATARNLFMEKFLFWKVLPIRCLRWVLDFAILCSPPALERCVQLEKNEYSAQKDVVRHLGEAWATKEFIQSAPIQQQNYLTAALGICLGSINKDTLESINGLVSSLLKGVSNRLDSPLHSVRRMAKQIALSFSTIVDPEKPLLIDDGDSTEDLLNWEGCEQAGSRNLDILVLEEEGKKKSAKLENALGDNSKGLLTQEEEKYRRRERRKKRKEKMEKLTLEEDDPDAIVILGEETIDSESEESSDTYSDSESSLQPYDMSDDGDDDAVRTETVTRLVDLAATLRKGDNADGVVKALQVSEKLVLAMPEELDSLAADLTHALVHVQCSVVSVEGEEDVAEERRHRALVALLASSPLRSVSVLTAELFSQHVDTSQRILILDVMAAGAKALASGGVKGSVTLDEDRRSRDFTNLPETTGSNTWYGPGSEISRTGVGPWVEVPSPLLSGTLVGWGQTYQRELPPRQGQRVLGKTRRWGQRAMQMRKDERIVSRDQPQKNGFASVAAAFMLPVMRDYDKKWQGVEVLGRDFLVLGGILSMLGVCMQCITMHREAAIFGEGLLQMLRSSDISNHSEVYVKRTALFAASRVLYALNPSDVVASFITGTTSLVVNLEWLREWALEIAMSDEDTDCAKLAAACVQLHSEMALQVQRSMGSFEHPGQTLEVKIPSSQRIIMPF